MKTNYVLWSVLVFSFTCMIRDSSVLQPELHRGKKIVDANCWFPGDAAAAKQMKLAPSSPKALFVESSDKTYNTTGRYQI